MDFSSISVANYLTLNLVFAWNSNGCHYVYMFLYVWYRYTWLYFYLEEMEWISLHLMDQIIVFIMCIHFSCEKEQYSTVLFGLFAKLQTQWQIILYNVCSAVMHKYKKYFICFCFDHLRVCGYLHFATMLAFTRVWLQSSPPWPDIFAVTSTST